MSWEVLGASLKNLKGILEGLDGKHLSLAGLQCNHIKINVCKPILEGAALAASVLVENIYLEILQDARIYMPNNLFVDICIGMTGEGYMQNGILKTALGQLLATLGAFFGTSWAFLSLPPNCLFWFVFFATFRFALECIRHNNVTIYQDHGNL